MKSRGDKKFSQIMRYILILIAFILIVFAITQIFQQRTSPSLAPNKGDPNYCQWESCIEWCEDRFLDTFWEWVQDCFWTWCAHPQTDCDDECNARYRDGTQVWQNHQCENSA